MIQSNNIFSLEWNILAETIHNIAKRNGFWEGDRNDGEILALVHAEVSEALEAVRKKIPEKSKKIPIFFEIEEELADIIIRIMDYGEARGWNIPDAILHKVEYNSNRPYKHGKRF